MKRMKTVGIIALVLAGLVLLTGIFAQLLRARSAVVLGLVEAADSARAAVDAAQLNLKDAQSAARKADTAVSGAEAALEAAEAALEELGQTLEGLGAQPDDEDALHALYRQVMQAQENMGPSGETLLKDALDGAVLSAQAMLAGALQDMLTDEHAQVEKAQAAQADARAAVNGVSAAMGSDTVLAQDQPLPFAIEPGETMMDNVLGEAQTLSAQADWTLRLAREDQAQAALLLEEAARIGGAATIDGGDRLIEWLRTYYIAIWFTGALLLAIGVLLTFFADAFLRQWKRNPVFSTFMALVVLLIIQTYSMRFTYPSIGAWASFWLDNAFNVLRGNTSVGIIALGMTLVVITGGIDLAVGSTLAGVGTVLMVLIDTSSRGLLGSLGITGPLAFVIGILGGFAAGALIGALIGLGVTKGRVPPFIITLGVMNIVRSVAQYFTKSYTPRVPSEFTAIANTVIFGQRLLPILYWLALAVILYIVMRRTRFGRYVYAVGSNERTSRLSGINVDRVKLMVYTLMGFLVSIASVVQVSRLAGMDVASAGSGYELDAIAAVVVGGTSMSGGRGSIVGTVIGVLIIGVMNNLLILLGVDSFLTNAFKGAIVIAAVLMQRKEKEA